MKKVIKVMIICLFVILCSSFFSLFASTYNVNDQVNLGKYNIYYRLGNSYIRYRGIGQWNYMYFYRDYNNVEHKAFCLNLGLDGAEAGDYVVDANTLIQDPKVASILISGSPYKTLAELGLNNEEEATFATQFAVWTYLNNLDLSLITPYAAGNENVVEAIKKIYYDGMNMNYTTEAILKIEKVRGVDIDSKDRGYYSQTYKIEHNQNIKNITLSTIGISNVKITDINNNQINNLNNVNEFKVLIPRSSISENKELLLNFRAESKQTSVMFGVTNLSDRQNMGLLLDPVNFRTIQDKFTVNYKTCKINIRKIDKDIKVGVAGVKFRFETLDGKNLGEYTTNSNGIIDIDVQKHLGILKEQKIKVTEISAPSNYTINSNNSKIVEIKWENNISLNFENEKKKNKLKVIKVDLDNNSIKLKGVEFKVLDSKGNIVDTLITNEKGEAVTKLLPIDQKYRVQEIKTLDNYVLNNEIKTVTLQENQITNITFTNKKKKGQIKVIKVDFDNNDIRIKGVEFKVLDSKGNIVDTLITDEKGEAVTKLLPIDQKYIVQETKTLDNYVLNDEIKTVTLQENQITNITFVNEKIKGKIKILKYSSEDNKYTKLEAETSLQGAVFDIIDSNNNIVDTISTDENGIAITKDLVKGKYKIIEIKPSDYYLLNENIFEIEIKNHKEIIEQVVYDDSVNIDIEIEKNGFIETQNKDNIFYNFRNIHNKSNIPLDNFTWNDILPIDAVRLDKIYTGIWNEKLEYSVWYKTNKKDFKLFKDKLDTEIVYELDFNKLELQEDEYITEFEFRFGTVKIDFCEVESPIVFVNILNDLENGFIFTNNTKISGNYIEEYIEDNDKWSTLIYNKKVCKNKELPKTGI